MDASSPRDKDQCVKGWMYSPDKPGSVNSTIMVEDFPATLTSTEEFVRALWRSGRACLIMKKDLVSAYKHQKVHEDDIKLQVVNWGGRYFIELALMFGTRSSPGIFSDLFHLFVVCIINLVEMDKCQVLQHLDDVLAIGIAGKDSPVHRFHSTFLEEAKYTGF